VGAKRRQTRSAAQIALNLDSSRYVVFSLFGTSEWIPERDSKGKIKHHKKRGTAERRRQKLIDSFAPVSSKDREYWEGRLRVMAISQKDVEP